MNHATTRQLMRLTHTRELLSWTQRIATSGRGCSFFVAAILRVLISTTLPCLRTFTRKLTRTILVPLQAHSGQVERRKSPNLLRTKQLRHGSTIGREESLIFHLHSNCRSLIYTIKETEDFKVLVPHHPVKNRLVPIKNHLATHQFENNTRHHQR